MEDMDIDMVVDAPDTPDRVGVCRINGGEGTGKESNSSVAVCSRNSGFMDEERFNRLRSRGRLLPESRHNRRLHLHPRKNPSNDIGIRKNSIVFPPLENSLASGGSLLFRRPEMDKNSRHENRHSIGAQHMDIGKSAYTEFPSKSSAYQESNAIIDSDQQNGHDQLLEMAFPRGASKSFPAEEIREGRIATNGGSSLHGAQSFFKTAGNTCKGKEKIGDNTSKGAGSATDGKSIDLSSESEHTVEKHISSSHQPVILPRVTGQKRLVRNGCISPHIIETRSKQLAEQDRNSMKDNDIEQSHTGNAVFNDPPLINVRDIVADDNTYDRVRGKGVIIHPHTSTEHDAKIIHLSSSSNLDNKKANGASDASRDALGCFQGLGGWRSTRDRSKKIDQASSETSGHTIGRNNIVGRFVGQQHENRVVIRDNRSENNNMDSCNYPVDQDATQRASRLVHGPPYISEPCHVASTLTKRQRENGLTSKNHGECSRMVSNDSEVVFLGSSGQSSSSRSSRMQNRRRQGMPNPVFEIDNYSTEVRLIDSHGTGCVNNDQSDARTRQVEADEMLARELQEQLYQEVPLFGGVEMDESMAWALQQEDAPLVASSQNHRVAHPRSSLIPHSRRQLTSCSFRRSSNRRITQARIPAPAQMTQLRGRPLSRSPAASSRARNFQFPSDMDLDMRLDILEALETAVGELGDSMSTTSHILQFQRDFNEEDYEMLLALDENNYQHGGASVNQINSLPESTIQTDNFEEACAICLETPIIGETIRHLPCLHKFHKDCIDPWLSRRTSCPICKSSVT